MNLVHKNTLRLVLHMSGNGPQTQLLALQGPLLSVFNPSVTSASRVSLLLLLLPLALTASLLQPCL